MVGKTLGYRRVSTEDQNLDRQLADVTVDKMFEDKLSGKNADRPQLQALIDYARDGDKVLVHSVDRLARSIVDLRDIVDKITDKGAAIEFRKENLVFTKATPNPFAKMLFQLLGVFAEFELDLGNMRRIEGIHRKREYCKKNNIPLPWTGRKPTLNSAQVLRCIEKVSKGLSISSVARDITEFQIKYKSGSKRGEVIQSVSRQTLYRQIELYIEKHPEVLETYPNIAKHSKEGVHA